MKEVKVSIIVSIYNSAKFLRQGLESIKNQNWTNYEVLMMNDGSTDDSSQICEEYASKDDRFIHVFKENTGVCDSRNQGLDKASGEFVCFMDGDDWLAPDFISYMMEMIEKTSAKMSLSDRVFTTRNMVPSNDDSYNLCNSEDVILNIIYMNMLLGPWNKMYSMGLIKEKNIGFPSTWFGETLHFANEIAYYSQNVCVGHKKVYYYRLNNLESGTTRFNVETRLMSLKNVESLEKRPFAKTKRVKRAIKWHVYDNHFLIVVNVLATKAQKKYLLEYKRSLSYLRKNCLRVFLTSKVRAKKKLFILLEGLFPFFFAKVVIRRIIKNRNKQSHM